MFRRPKGIPVTKALPFMGPLLRSCGEGIPSTYGAQSRHGRVGFVLESTQSTPKCEEHSIERASPKTLDNTSNNQICVESCRIW